MKSELRIMSGLKKLVDYDDHLLRVDASERSMTHRLGMYYEDLFPKWNVDCEYNRYFGGPKDVEFDIRNLLHRMFSLIKERNYRIARDLMGNFVLTEDNVSEELRNLGEQLRDPRLEYDPEQDLYFFLLQLLNGEVIRKSIVPDIIVHKRNRRNNFIAIEAKKTSNTSVASREYDILKLQALITDTRYAYKQGYFIDLPVLTIFESFTKFNLVPDSFEPRIKLILPR